MSTSSEREPLLPPANVASNDPVKADQRRLGPMELSRSTKIGILAGIWSANLLSCLNLTLVPTMIPSISSEFNRSHQASWLGTSYLLATCTFTPLYGRLCNILGRKRANHVAILFAGLGTLACGLSTNMEMLIAARFISGIGGGGVFTTSTIVVSDMYDLRSRGLIQGMASVCNGIGMGLGGPLGGLITDWLGWRAAFLLQVPLFTISLVLTSIYLNYTVPSKQKSTAEVWKRIDFGGSFALLISVGSCLFFLASKYNEMLPWSDPKVIAPLVLSIVFMILFIIVEIFVAREPVLAPFLLKQRIPVLVGCSNFLVAMCNFSIQYFFPMWFQTVMLTNASTAGLHIAPNSVSMSTGSLFAGWMMHRTGKYKKLNLIFGTFPFIGTVLIWLMREDSGPIQSWLSIIPLGFGNAVVLQTMLIALLAHLPESHMAVGTGFGQCFRGVGQVAGVAVSSAIFQSSLERQLRRRITGPNKDQLVKDIRQIARLIEKLPPDLQRIARDSYSGALKNVFLFAAVSTLLAYLVRLPIPEKDLDKRPSAPTSPVGANSDLPAAVAPVCIPTHDEEEPRVAARGHHRRLSTYESTDGIMDFESETVGGSARKGSPEATR
ncbi:vacuolar amino acid permease [Mycena floridula]|nr:vacuolar amino acid permease [Mycena floridula]